MDKNAIINAPDFENLVKYTIRKYKLYQQIKLLGISTADLMQEIRYFIFTRRAPKKEISHTTYICRATIFCVREQISNKNKKLTRKKYQNQSLPDNIEIEEKEPEKYHESQKIAHDIIRHAPLTDKERVYLYQIYVNGQSQRAVSRNTNYTSANISLIVNKSLNKLRKFCNVKE